ncbi:MAG: 50S ribosomal protein L24 [Candidatus Binatia bacterium]
MGTTKRKIQHNDIVEVIAGKEKGKKGKVLKVLPGEERVVVEKVNLIKRHVRPGKLGQQSGIIEREGKLHISNVMVVCTRCNSPVRVSRQLSPEGRKVRVCKRCGEAIDKT